MDNWYVYTRIVTELLVILDPFAAVPLLISLTSKYSTKERRKVASVTAVTVIVTLVLFAFLGSSLLAWMGTSLASFRVGGGVVLLMMAIALLRGSPEIMSNSVDSSGQVNMASTSVIVPLAIPMLAGPGAIGTVIIAMQRSSAPYHALSLVACIFIVGLILWFILFNAEYIAKKLQPVGLNILNRLFGLILMAIAIEIMASGLKQLFPILSGSILYPYS